MVLSLHWIWYLVSSSILCHHGNFSDEISYAQVTIFCHGSWIMDELIYHVANTLPSLVSGV